MPKAIIDSVRGINQTAGSGLSVTGMPVTYFDDGVTYQIGGTTTVPASTDVANINITANSAQSIELADGTFHGQVKIIVIGTVAGGSSALNLKNDDASNVLSISTGAVPGVVVAGDAFMCIYSGTSNKWFLLE